MLRQILLEISVGWVMNVCGLHGEDKLALASINSIDGSVLILVVLVVCTSHDVLYTVAAVSNSNFNLSHWYFWLHTLPNRGVRLQRITNVDISKWVQSV